jgi:hypothetical protein
MMVNASRLSQGLGGLTGDRVSGRKDVVSLLVQFTIADSDDGGVIAGFSRWNAGITD